MGHNCRMRPMDRFIVAALVLAGSAVPAFAGVPIQVPEPATMTLFGVGAAGAPLTLRWFGNIALFAMALLMTWLMPLLSSLGAAAIAAQHGLGLFHLITLPPAITLAASFVLLDFLGYWTHRLLHKIPLLW